MILDDKKTINAWCSYDWSNSVYNLIITTAIFPIYYSDSTSTAFGGSLVSFFGFSIDATVLYTYAISFSFLLAVILYPILSGTADFLGAKKAFMRFFTYMGSFACIGLYFFEGSNIEYGIIMAITASLGYASSVVFYNAFLPEIASINRMDDVSARGFSMGYVGSVLLLIVSLILVSFPNSFGFEGAGSATKFIFLLVGIWWFGFAHISFSVLKDQRTNGKVTRDVLKSGFSELSIVFQTLKKNIQSIRFLYSFFFYSMGVQTVMLLAPLFAKNIMKMESSEMIIMILIIQLVAIIGAYSFAWLSKKKGNKTSIIIAIIVWIAICLIAFVIENKNLFFAMAGLLGLVMGGIQSISRSTFSKLLPAGVTDTASYFSFYDVTEKLAIVLGTVSFGYILQLTGTMRNSMLFMGIFFIIGIIILSRAQLSQNTEN